MPNLPLLRQALQLASPSGPRAKLQIFIFHRVLPQADPLLPGEVDAQRPFLAARLHAADPGDNR